MLKSNSVEGCVTAYLESFPELERQADETLAFTRDRSLSVKNIKSLLLSHADLQRQEQFGFSLQQIATDTDIPMDGLVQAMSHLSCHFGDLAQLNPEHFFLDNPVWTKPVIRLNDDQHYCCLPQMFFTFAFRILDGLLSKTGSHRDACARRRKQYLEDTVKQILVGGLPDCTAAQNVHWRLGPREYETDLLVRVDSFLFVIEAKSGAVTPPALRGAPERLGRQVRELLVEPAQQSQRFAEEFEHAIQVQSDSSSDSPGFLAQLPLDVTGVRHVVRLSVTLEDLGALQSNVAKLVPTGWVPADLRLAPTMTLCDLRVVFEILSSPAERIHYLVRRSELQEQWEYDADEIDLLGLNLETGFNLGNVEFTEARTILTGMSQSIDDYYIAMDANIRAAKPQRKGTKWWSDIGAQLARRKLERWTEAAVMLLNVAPDDQLTLEQEFDRVLKRLRSRPRRRRERDMLLLTPPADRPYGFALVGFRQVEASKRRSKMEVAADRAFRTEHVKHCLVIAVNADYPHYPYDALGVYDRPRGSPTKAAGPPGPVPAN
jgi:hypothetical protein